MISTLGGVTALGTLHTKIFEDRNCNNVKEMIANVRRKLCPTKLRDTIKARQNNIIKRKKYLSADDIRNVVADVDGFVCFEHLQCHLQVGLLDKE